MRVRDLLARKASTLVTVTATAELETAVRLLIDNNIGGLPVIGSDGAVVGLVAERDVVRVVHQNQDAVRHLRVQQVMRVAPTCDADEALEDVMRRMTRERHRHLVVQDQGRLAGVLSVGDIVKHRLDELELETGVLRDYVAGQRAAR